MVQTQNGQEKAQTLKTTSLYTWRLNRHESEKHAEAVNRELMHRQFKN